jgi:hypothetical protein
VSESPSLRPPTPERQTIDGPAGTIEALLEAPPARSLPCVGVVCHPHPLFGGAMTNKVVHSVARCWNELGVPTLRFNFRGVGASQGRYDEGRGETDDALAVIEFGRRRWPDAALWLAGFSFGAYVALRTAARARPALLVAVAPPVGRWDFTGLAAPACPWLIVQGDRDDLVDAAAVQAWAGAQRPEPQVAMLAGAEHFFHGRLHDLREAVRDFSRRVTGVERA